MKRHFYLSIAVCMLVVLAGMGYTSWKKQTVKEQQKAAVLKELKEDLKSLEHGTLNDIFTLYTPSVSPQDPDKGQLGCISQAPYHRIYSARYAALLKVEEKINSALDTQQLDEQQYIQFIRELTSMKNTLIEVQIEYEKEVAACQKQMLENWVEKEMKQKGIKAVQRKYRGSCSPLRTASTIVAEKLTIMEELTQKIERLHKEIKSIPSDSQCDSQENNSPCFGPLDYPLYQAQEVI